jgi:hypothetical protein
MHPAPSDFQTLLATVRRRINVPDLCNVLAGIHDDEFLPRLDIS